ncbi:hypothetical protein RF11_13285 [Thelohanellus kitauei]|uniref:Uncharacterized protein n=1 Tax=Thelohanellus kitauei TaxID=669202 RepID=A0A0C2J535_THEKT|nr:hypothetical protein RF11_13285 [Thelohanellus kitauei]
MTNNNYRNPDLDYRTSLCLVNMIFCALAPKGLNSFISLIGLCFQESALLADRFTFNLIATTHIEDGNIKKTVTGQVKLFLFTGAGQAYLEAGKLAEIDDPNLNVAKTYYEISADCYRKILSGSAFESYRKWIEVLVKQFNDVTKAKDFYDSADTLRRENNYTTFTFCDRVSHWRDAKFSEEIKYIKLADIREQERRTLEETTVCGKCVCFWSLHSKYIREIGLKHPSKRVDFVTNNHEKYRNELELACAQYNQLADQSQIQHPEERTNAT